MSKQVSLNTYRYNVVLVVRSEEKGDKVVARHPDRSRDQLSVAIVPDFTEPNAFASCVKKISDLYAVIHVASPYHFSVSDIQSELLDPSIKGIESLLNAVKEYASTVKKVVSQLSKTFDWQIMIDLLTLI